MKKTASFICILLALIMIFSGAMPAVVFAEEKQYTEKTVTAYLFDMEPTADITLLFDVELPEFPYISAAEYLDQVYVCDFTETKNEDGTFSISDPYGTMIVDAEKDTVFFECYELFVMNDDYSEDSHFEVPYILSMETELIGECKPLTLDLGKYGFDIVEYDGKVYFPVTILNDIFCLSYCAAEYVDGNLYFLYTLEEEYDAYFDRESLYNKLERDEAMVRLTYNELCFAIDNFYGAPSNALIAESIKEKGLDKTLDEYSDDTRKMKELLLSDDLVDFYVGFSCLDSLFYDGGHTVFFFDPDTSAELYPDTEFGKIWNSFLEELSDPDVDEYSDERIGLLAEASEQYTWDMIRGLLANSARIEGFEKYKTVKEWDETAVLLVSGETAVFSFDTFADDVIEPFKWSLDYAAKHKIKSFILDLTVNGGGQISCLWYILTMITNKTNKTNEACEKAVSTVTGNTYVSNMLIDLNLDGKFDDADKEVAYDFDFAILTTKCSFSCGNLLPVLAKENGIAIIGETSGGGSCSIVQLYTPEFSFFTLSAADKSLSDLYDIDGGAQVDYYLAKPYVDPETGEEDEDMNDYSDLYDIKNIGKLVKEFYGRETGETEITSTPKTGDDFSLVWVLFFVSGISLMLAYKLRCRR